MTEFSDNDPFVGISGEPASEQDLLVLDGLAVDLAEAQFPCLIRNYAYEIDSFYLVFHQAIDTDPGCVSDIATIVVSDTFGNDRVILSFSNDGEMCLPIQMPDEDEQTEELVEIVQSFLEADLMDEEESAVAKYLQKTLMNDEFDEYDTWVTPSSGHERIHISDIIRKKMTEKNVPIVKEYEYGLPMEGNTYELKIIRHVLDGTFFRETDLCYLPIFIELIDRAGEEGRIVNYRQLMDGYRSMEIDSGFTYEDELEEDEDVETFKRELGLDTPQKPDVELLTKLLIDASIADTTVVDIGLN